MHGSAAARLATRPLTSTSLAAPAEPMPYDRGELSVESQVQQGLNLFLPLKSRAQMPALLRALDARKDDTRAALASLHYVHFARFVPTPDGSALMVITEYDGDLKSYVMDFVAVLGDVFTAILEFVDGAPRLPVKRYPADFWAFVQSHNMRLDPWSAYPHMTVIDILNARRER